MFQKATAAAPPLSLPPPSPRARASSIDTFLMREWGRSRTRSGDKAVLGEEGLGAAPRRERSADGAGTGGAGTERRGSEPRPFNPLRHPRFNHRPPLASKQWHVREA